MRLFVTTLLLALLTTGSALADRNIGGPTYIMQTISTNDTGQTLKFEGRSCTVLGGGSTYSAFKAGAQLRTSCFGHDTVEMRFVSASGKSCSIDYRADYHSQRPHVAASGLRCDLSSVADSWAHYQLKIH